MRKKFPNITNRFIALAFWLFMIVIWQVVCWQKWIQPYMLPSPIDIVQALIDEFPLLMDNTLITLYEAFCGLFLGIILAFIFAVLMDRFNWFKTVFYPMAVISQTIPVIAIAPLLILWLGVGTEPKITLVLIVCFFPILVSMYDGLKSVDQDMLNLFKTMGANKWQTFRHVKLWYAMSNFFSGLKISVSYAIVGGLISEWLGGTEGLGVYMLRYQKSFNLDKMFAVIIIIIVISLLCIKMVNILEKRIKKDA